MNFSKTNPVSDADANDHALQSPDPRAGIALLSGTIAYFLMFTIVPAATAFILLYSITLSPQTIQSYAQSLTASLPGTESQVLTGLIANISASSAGQRNLGGLVALVLALWGLLGGAGTLVQSVGMYSGLPATNFIRQKWRALVVAIHLFLAILVAVAAIVAPSAIPTLPGLSPATSTLVIGIAGHLIALLALAWLVTGILAQAGLGARRRIGISLGGLAGALLFIVGTALFSFYLANFGSYNATYGAIAGVIVLLLWLRVIGVSLLLGAKVDARHLTTT